MQRSALAVAASGLALLVWLPLDADLQDPPELIGAML